MDGSQSTALGDGDDGKMCPRLCCHGLRVHACSTLFFPSPCVLLKGNCISFFEFPFLAVPVGMRLNRCILYVIFGIEPQLLEDELQEHCFEVHTVSVAEARQ